LRALEIIECTHFDAIETSTHIRTRTATGVTQKRTSTENLVCPNPCTWVEQTTRQWPWLSCFPVLNTTVTFHFFKALLVLDSSIRRRIKRQFAVRCAHYALLILPFRLSVSNAAFETCPVTISFINQSAVVCLLCDCVSGALRSVAGAFWTRLRVSDDCRCAVSEVDRVRVNGSLFNVVELAA